MKKNISILFVHFIVGKFKMAATGHRKSYNRYIFGNNRYIVALCVCVCVCVCVRVCVRECVRA